MARGKRATTRVVYQTKVTLKESRPPIWRRMQVASDTTLTKLHHILQRVMGWEGSPLYQFVVGGMVYGGPRMLGDLDAKDARTGTLETSYGARSSSSSMSTTSGIAGNTSCSSKRYCPWTRGNATRSASRANAPVPPRIAGASGATRVFWKRSTIRNTPNTRRCWHGWGASLIRMPLIWTRLIRRSNASHSLRWGEGSDNFADHNSLALRPTV